MQYQRALPVLAEPSRRISNWGEFHGHLPIDEMRQQGARCMNCGVPFCHTGIMEEGRAVGCPLHNLIPEWNDLVFRGKWREAYERLAATNNFPEFTGRVCPAPCESSCVLGINEEPVMIKEIEVSIIDKAFEEGWVTSGYISERSGKRVAVIGSGPAGMACAQELNNFGHDVTVYERSDRVGGLLMYGIPNMKLDKGIVRRRVDMLSEEGISFVTGIEIGKDITAAELKEQFDAIVLCCGSPKPRDLAIPGRDLPGIYMAMEYLTSTTKHLLDGDDSPAIDLRGMNVVVIGGGDTGTDCVGTAIRQGCKSVVQFELTAKPPLVERYHGAWLDRVRTFQVDYGQEEAAAVFGDDPRRYQLLTKRFLTDGQAEGITGLETVEVEWTNGKMNEIKGSSKVWEADAVLLAMGFIGGDSNDLFTDLGLKITGRNTISVNENKQTNVAGIFAAGDCERGQSLVVWAIADGRKAAAGVNDFLARTSG